MKKVYWFVLIALIIVGVAVYLNYFTGEAIWERDKCRTDAKCFPGDSDCDYNNECLTGYCAKGVGAKYAYPHNKDVCECPSGQAWNNDTLTCYPCPSGQVVDIETFSCVPNI